MTLSELLEQYPTTCKATSIPMRTDAGTYAVWSRQARHWHITISAHDAGRDGGYSMPARGIVALEFSQGAAHTKPPTVRDVLGSLISDAALVESCGSLDEFAAEMSIEKPTAAFRAWNACLESGEKLAVLYGRGTVDDIDTEGF